MTKKTNPTPWLGKPNSSRQLFTVSENKLLDQMTMEIMEAWASDLRLMKSHYLKTVKFNEHIEEIVNRFTEASLKIQEVTLRHDFKHVFESSIKCIPSIEMRLAEIDKTLFELDKKFNFSYVQSLIENIKKIENITQVIQKQIEEIKSEPNKKWWRRIFS